MGLFYFFDHFNFGRDIRGHNNGTSELFWMVDMERDKFDFKNIQNSVSV